MGAGLVDTRSSKKRPVCALLLIVACGFGCRASDPKGGDPDAAVGDGDGDDPTLDAGDGDAEGGVTDDAGADAQIEAGSGGAGSGGSGAGGAAGDAGGEPDAGDGDG